MTEIPSESFETNTASELVAAIDAPIARIAWHSAADTKGQTTIGKGRTRCTQRHVATVPPLFD